MQLKLIKIYKIKNKINKNIKSKIGKAFYLFLLCFIYFTKTIQKRFEFT